MQLLKNVLGLIFFSLLGMFCVQLLTGHWWIFFIVVAVIGVASYVKRAAERKRRHERVRGAIKQRVRELQHE
jgi:protein-S-isoprenylcysteine O-methyltransferase Ste14